MFGQSKAFDYVLECICNLLVSLVSGMDVRAGISICAPVAHDVAATDFLAHAGVLADRLVVLLRIPFCLEGLERRRSCH